MNWGLGIGTATLPGSGLKGLSKKGQGSRGQGSHALGHPLRPGRRATCPTPVSPKLRRRPQGTGLVWGVPSGGSQQRDAQQSLSRGLGLLLSKPLLSCISPCSASGYFASGVRVPWAVSQGAWQAGKSPDPSHSTHEHVGF